MEKVVIIGGGISGLVAAFAFSQFNVDTCVIEGGRPGGEFASGGLKYLNRTDAMAEMLHQLDITFTNYYIQGGISLHGKVEPYPACFSKMDKERAKRIQLDHYRKTRRTEPDAFAAKSMNDPEASGSRRALNCDASVLLRKLVNNAVIKKAHAKFIDVKGRAIVTPLGERIPWDYLVVTIPLWILARIAPFEVPESMAMRLNIVQIEPRRDPYAKWDYVYTPYTPEDLIHRISPRDGGYHCEFNGAWEVDDEAISARLTSDLNFLFPDGWALQHVVRGINGHLLPLPSKMLWPERIRPLGRFAVWDPRATTDVVLDSAFDMAKEWGLKRKL